MQNKQLVQKDNETEIHELPWNKVTDEIHINFLVCIEKRREEPLTKRKMLSVISCIRCSVRPVHVNIPQLQMLTFQEQELSCY